MPLTLYQTIIALGLVLPIMLWAMNNAGLIYQVKTTYGKPLESHHSTYVSRITPSYFQKAPSYEVTLRVLIVCSQMCERKKYPQVYIM